MAIDTQSSPPVHGGGAGADRTADEILDSLALALLVAGPDGSIRYRNATAAARLPAGRDLDTAFGLARFAEPFDGWSREIQRVLRTGASVRYTCVFPGSNERPAVSATVRCTPLLSQSGEAAAGVVILVEEATEQDMLERQLEVSQRLAALGKLAARVAHELNNPLDGILRYVNLAMRLAGEFSEPRLQSYLAESRTGLMRMVGIIGDLLQFSRSTDGEFDEVSINEVVERAIQATAPAAEAGRVIVAADFHTRQMPSIRGSRLYQVLCNLIRNAIDAMPDGGRLTVTTALINGQAVIEVADTGVGLPEDVDRMFEPFYTTKEAGKGTGLGLAICKDFVEDMKGTITASPGEEGGAVLVVRIPVDTYDAPVSPGRSAAAADLPDSCDMRARPAPFSEPP